MTLYFWGTPSLPSSPPLNGTLYKYHPKDVNGAVEDIKDVVDDNADDDDADGDGEKEEEESDMSGGDMDTAADEEETGTGGGDDEGAVDAETREETVL